MRGLALLVLLSVLGGCSDPTQGLLAGVEPVDGRGAYRPGRLTDGVVDYPGGDWASDGATVLESDRASVVWQLDSVQPLGIVRLQSDASDRYLVEGSVDGAGWTPLLVSEPVPGREGMRTETADAPQVSVLFVRLRAEAGDGRYGAGELQVFAPDGPTPRWTELGPRIVPTRAEQLSGFAARKLVVGLFAILAFLTLTGGASGRLRVLSMLAAGLAGGLAVGMTLGAVVLGGFAGGAIALVAFRPAPESSWPRLRVLALVALAVAGALSWSNFGVIHSGWGAHHHDGFHHFMGSKYAEQLGYDGLYDCAVAAEAERPYWLIERQAAVRNLADNTVGSWSEALVRGQWCAARFGEEGWAEFGADVRWFQAQMTPEGWLDVLTAHGYFATPPWTAVFAAIGAGAKASTASLGALALLDPLLYALGFGALFAAFGLETGVLALLLWGLGFPWTREWTAGGMGGAGWFAGVMLGVSLARTSRWTGSGIALGGAAALRGFPGVFLLVPAAAWLRQAFIQRSWRSGQRSLLQAATVMLLLGALVPVLFVGVEVWWDFAVNADKHFGAVGANKMGLEALIEALLTPGLASQVLLRAGQLAGIVGVIMVGLRLSRPWQRVVVAGALLPVVFPVTSYDCVFVVLLAPMLLSDRSLMRLFLTGALFSNVPLLLGVDPMSGTYSQVVSLGLLVLLATFVVRAGLGGRASRT